jgi:hypothetical protein
VECAGASGVFAARSGCSEPKWWCTSGRGGDTASAISLDWAHGQLRRHIRSGDVQSTRRPAATLRAVDAVALASVISSAAVGLAGASVAFCNTRRTAKTAKEGRAEQRAADGYLKVLSLAEQEARWLDATAFNLGLDPREVAQIDIRVEVAEPPGVTDKAMPGRRREPHPPPPTDPDVNLSAHPARAVQSSVLSTAAPSARRGQVPVSEPLSASPALVSRYVRAACTSASPNASGGDRRVCR